MSDVGLYVCGCLDFTVCMYRCSGLMQESTVVQTSLYVFTCVQTSVCVYRHSYFIVFVHRCSDLIVCVYRCSVINDHCVCVCVYRCSVIIVYVCTGVQS